MKKLTKKLIDELKNKKMRFNIDSDGDIVCQNYNDEDIDIIVCEFFADNDERCNEDSEFYSSVNSTFFTTSTSEDVEMTRVKGEYLYILISNIK
jgi:hypothetical protein